MNPTRLMYYCSAFSPAGFVGLLNNANRVFPSPELKITDKYKEVLRVIAEKNQWHITQNEPMVMNVGVEMPESAYLKNTLAGNSCFEWYDVNIPDWKYGNSLVALVPLTLPDVIVILKKQFYKFFRLKFK